MKRAIPAVKNEVIVLRSLAFLHGRANMCRLHVCKIILLSAAPGSQDELNITRYDEVKSVCKEKQWEGLKH